MGEIKIGSYMLGMVQTNCYFVYRTGPSTSSGTESTSSGTESTSSGTELTSSGTDATDAEPVEASVRAIVIDPGDLGDRIYEDLQNKGVEVDTILLTHAHFDHVLGLEALKEKCGAPVYCLDAEQPLCDDPSLNCSRDIGHPVTVKVDRYLKDKEVLDIADIQLEVIATPGHTAGSCSYYLKEAGCVFSGDTLFEDSVGRTDLPTGSMSTLVRSIKERLFVLPDDTVVYSGHGPETTIGHEKQYNPFL